MTKQEFFAALAMYQALNPTQRRGQAVFNLFATLTDHQGIPMNATVGTEFDPFYFDDRVEAFLEYQSDALEALRVG